MEFEIFKTGSHTSDKGITKDYTEDDLNFIASSYNPSESEAPIVIGHPVDNAPAYGWIESLKVVGDKLMAKAKQVVPEFTEALKNGLYKKRSISLDKEGNLRHVGFLGAAAPAVKGLADIQFNAEETDSIEFEIETKSEETENPKVVYPEIPEKIFSSITDQLKFYSVHSFKFFFKFQRTEFISNKKYSNDLENLKSKIDLNEFEKKLNTKISEGSFTPAMKQKSINILEFLNTQNYSEGFEIEKFKSDIKLLLSEFIDSVPKIIYYENFAEKPDSENLITTEDYSGLQLDESSAAMHKKALTLAKKDNISYESAILKLNKRTN